MLVDVGLTIKHTTFYEAIIVLVCNNNTQLVTILMVSVSIFGTEIFFVGTPLSTKGGLWPPFRWIQPLRKGVPAKSARPKICSCKTMGIIYKTASTMQYTPPIKSCPSIE